MPACEKCKYYASIDETSGECRKSTPRTKEFNGILCGVWPRVSSTAWCGQFQSTPPEKPAYIVDEMPKGGYVTGFSKSPKKGFNRY